MLSNLINICLNNTTCSSPKVNQDYIIAKGDSGASNHYFQTEDKRVLSDIKPATGPDVHQPDSTVLITEATGIIPIDETLSSKVTKVMVLPQLKSASLISMGKLCDDDCLVVLSKKKLAVVKNNKIVLRGTRNKNDDLWDIPIYKKNITEANFKSPKTHSGLYLSPRKQKENSTPHSKVAQPPKPRLMKPDQQHNINLLSVQRCTEIIKEHKKLDQQKWNLLRTAVTPKDKKIGVIIRKKQAHRDLVRYLHATCFSLVSSMWEQAIKQNHFSTWPGLTAKLVTKHLPTTAATIQGHLHWQRQNLQSTKKLIKKEPSIKDQNILFPWRL